MLRPIAHTSIIKMINYDHNQLFVGAIACLIAVATPPVSAQSYSSHDCASRCGTIFGEGTHVDSLRQELMHDARHPLIANVSCSSLLETAISVSFRYAHYTPVTKALHTAYFMFRLEAWQCGILRFNFSTGCYQDWYLVSGYVSSEPPSWECRTLLLQTEAEEHCQNAFPSTCDNKSLPLVKLTCNYSLTNLLNFTESVRCLMSQDILKAATCRDRNTTGSHQCLSMNCTYPNVDGTGMCGSWHSSDEESVWAQRNSTFIFSNGFGLAIASSTFSLGGIAALSQPRHNVLAVSSTARTAVLSLCIDRSESEWMSRTRSVVQFRIVTSGISPQASSVSPKVISTSCNGGEALCRQTSSGFAVSRCTANISELHPAEIYSYQVYWRVNTINEVSPWSRVGRGVLRTPDAVPESSPVTVFGAFSEANCSAKCTGTRHSSAACTETTIYWKSVPASERNGELTRILLFDSLNWNISLPVNNTFFTLCSSDDEGGGEYKGDEKKMIHTTEDVHIRLTVENAAGSPNPSKWTEITIPRTHYRLQPVSDIVVKPGSTAGSVQLWWRYGYPVDMFIILCLNDEEPHEPLLITQQSLADLEVGTGKWTYVLDATHLGIAGATMAKRCGIGVVYNNRSSGIVFSSPCAIYSGNKAPEIEVVGNVVAEEARVRINVRLAASYISDPCSFAGPFLRVRAAIVVDSDLVATTASSGDSKSRMTEVPCDGWAWQQPQLTASARQITVTGLASNRKYVIVLRSVLNAGGDEITGPYSLPVYVRTLGLAEDEAAGVGVAAAAFLVLLAVAVLAIVRCHHKVGFGQKVSVTLIRNRGDECRGGRNAAKERLTVSQYCETAEGKAFLGDSSYRVMPQVAKCDGNGDSFLYALKPLGSYQPRISGKRNEECKKQGSQRQQQHIACEKKRRFDFHADREAAHEDCADTGNKNDDVCGVKTLPNAQENETPPTSLYFNFSKDEQVHSVFQCDCLSSLFDDGIQGNTPKTRFVCRCQDKVSNVSEVTNTEVSTSSMEYLQVSVIHGVLT